MPHQLKMADNSLDVCRSYLKVVAFLCVEGGERQVFWKPDWLVDSLLYATAWE
jgi:hypothetical protein